MGIPETLGVAAMGMGVVFAALVTLIILMWLLTSFTNAISKRTDAVADASAAESPAPPAAEMVPAKGSIGEIALYDVDDKTAAMVMAILADELQTPLNELRFRSIRERKSQKGGNAI